jgi:hypothetical protein
MLAYTGDKKKPITYRSRCPDRGRLRISNAYTPQSRVYHSKGRNVSNSDLCPNHTTDRGQIQSRIEP